MAEDDATSVSVDHDDDDSGDATGDVAQMRGGDGGDGGDGDVARDGTRSCDVARTRSLAQVWGWRLLSVSISRTVMSPPPQNQP